MTLTAVQPAFFQPANGLVSSCGPGTTACPTNDDGAFGSHSHLRSERTLRGFAVVHAELATSSPTAPRLVRALVLHRQPGAKKRKFGQNPLPSELGSLSLIAAQMLKSLH